MEKLKFRKFKEIKKQIYNELKYYSGKGCGEIYTSIGNIKVKCGTKRKEFNEILLCSRCYGNEFLNKKIEQKYPILFVNEGDSVQ